MNPTSTPAPIDRLDDLGWDPAFESDFHNVAPPDCQPGRVMRADKDRMVVATASGDMIAQLAGAMRHHAERPSDLPAVGDWVALQGSGANGHGIIRAVVPRRSRLARQSAGRTSEEQLIAANIDTILVVAGLDTDFNVRRLERYMVLCAESGADPVLVLNKADACDDPDEAIARVETISNGAPVHAVSAADGTGLDVLARYCRPSRTVLIVGSSGVGKSTLINALTGGAAGLKTGDVRHTDGRGQHTTTWRELVRLPAGGWLVDTPGMRELALWSDDPSSGTGPAFSDVEDLAEQCRFADCEHNGEPGCAVEAAIEAGELPADRLASFQHLRRELAHLERKQDQRAKQREVQRWKSISKSVRKLNKRRDRG
ncbi:MAG: ribosome small subunit-dependent GTPase A [Planctomycetota bacterium]